MNDHLSQAQPVAYRNFTAAEVERLARECLAGHDQDTRLHAQDQLRPLCHYDQWDNMKDLFLGTHDEYALFVLVKAALHITTNEVVPHERVTIMTFLYNYCAGNAHLSAATVGQIFRVTATCLYLNWRSMIFTFDGTRLADMLAAARIDSPLGQVIALEMRGAGTDDASPDPIPPQAPVADLGEKVLGDMEIALQGVVLLRLKAALEIVQHFSSEEKSGQSSPTVHETFVAFLLPRFFALAVDSMGAHFEPALRLCVACLEVTSPASARGLIERFSTDDTLYFVPMERWFGMLMTAVARVGALIHESLRKPECTEVEVLDASLQLAALVSQVQFDGVPEANLGPMLDLLLSIAMVSLMNAPHYTDMESLCHYGSAILINVFERHPMIAMMAFSAHPEYLQLISDLVTFVASDWTAFDDHAKGSLLTAVAMLLESTQGPVLDINISVADSSRMFERLSASFADYLDAVIANCHLSEGSDDVNCPEALQLTNDDLLRPVGLVLLTHDRHFGQMLTTVFNESLAIHDLCQRLKNGYKMQEHESDMILQMLSMVSATDADFDEETVVLVAARVALSRLGVVINIISLWLKHRNIRNMCLEAAMDDFHLLMLVANFAKSFVTDDIADLLMCMNLAGVATGAKNGAATLHVGILRSLLYFTNAVSSSSFAQQPVFIGCASSIINFVLSQHSLAAPVLAADCIAVIETFTKGSDGGCQDFIASPDAMGILKRHLEGNIALTAKEGLVACVAAQGADDRLASGRLVTLRKHLMRAFARLLDLRYRLGTDSGRQALYAHLDAIAAPLLDYELRASVGSAVVTEVFFSDLRGIAKAVEAPQLLFAIMQWVMNLKSTLVDVLSAHPNLALPSIKTWSKLTRQYQAQLSENLNSPLPVTFCSFVFDSIDFLLMQRQLERGPEFDLSVAEQGAIAVLLNGVLRGSWCNIAVMCHYGDVSIPRVLLAALRKFIRAPPAEVMSLKNRAAFFESIAASFNIKDATSQVRDAPDYVMLMSELALFLVACIRVGVTVPILHAVNVAFAPMSIALNDVNCVVPMFKELVVILTTNAAPDSRVSVPAICVVLHRMYRVFAEPCTEVLEGLLGQASAWHRVRIRCLLLMLSNDPHDLAAQFLSTFGSNTSREQLIAAW